MEDKPINMDDARESIEELYRYFLNVYKGRIVDCKTEEQRIAYYDSDTAYNKNIFSLFVTKDLHSMTVRQLAVAEAQKQLAESQTIIAQRQEEIAKRIEQGSDRTMKLTQRITWLTYVLVAVGIITFVAVCVQIAIAKQWI